MKKLLFAMLLVALTTICAYAGTSVNPDITLNGNKVSAEAYVKDGTTYVPVRVIAELFGTEISWDKQKQAVLLGTTSEALYQCIDDSTTDKTVKADGNYYDNHSVRVYKDGMKVTLQNADGVEVYAVMKDGVNYLPVRAISEAFGCTVTWNNTTKTVELTTTSAIEIPVVEVPSTDRPDGYSGGTYFAAGWTSSALSTYGHRALLEVASYDSTEDHQHGIWRTYTDEDFSAYHDNYSTDALFVQYIITERAEANTWDYANGTTEYMVRPFRDVNLGEYEIKNTSGQTLLLTMTGNGTCPDQTYVIPDGDTVILMAMKDGSGAFCLFSNYSTGALVCQYTLGNYGTDF